MKCIVCGNETEGVCEDCERPVCEDCESPFDFFLQNTCDLCPTCYESRKHRHNELLIQREKEKKR